MYQTLVSIGPTATSRKGIAVILGFVSIDLLCISKKPDNILVDYGVGNAGVVNFEMAIGDWGTAGGDKKHYGGTPMYASKLAFRLANNKDLFTFGRLAMELYLSESGM